MRHPVNGHKSLGVIHSPEPYLGPIDWDDDVQDFVPALGSEETVLIRIPKSGANAATSAIAITRQLSNPA